MAEEDKESDPSNTEHDKLLAAAQAVLTRRYSEIAEYISNQYWLGVQKGKSFSNSHLVRVSIPCKFGTLEVEESEAVLEQKYKLHFVGGVSYPGLFSIFASRTITVVPGQRVWQGVGLPGTRYPLI
jgi:hypothetical protein